MTEYYKNVTWQKFTNDFNDKQWVIILRDDDGSIAGFSTMKLYDDNKTRSKILFSGDTLVDRRFWGQSELQRVWSQFVFCELPKFHPESTLYWILITKGYKTYRLLYSNFIRYYPTFRWPTPTLLQGIVDRFCQFKYSGRYKPESGIIYNDGTGDTLKAGIADLSKKKLEDRDIAFFIEKNPGYLNGDELVCITEASRKNIQPHLEALIMSAVRHHDH